MDCPSRGLVILLRASLLLSACVGFQVGGSEKVGLRTRTQKVAASLVRLRVFHAEGDGSGDYLLSGMWQLTRWPDEHEEAAYQGLKLPAARPSWSGFWSSPLIAKRTPPAPKRVIVSLGPGGCFTTPPDTPEADVVRGKWSCSGRNVVLARFGRASQVIETYEGTLKPKKIAIATNNDNASSSSSSSSSEKEALLSERAADDEDYLKSAEARGAADLKAEKGAAGPPENGTVLVRSADIVGTMAVGAHDPEYAGKFSMEMLMPQLMPLRKRQVKKRRDPVFNMSHLLGKWTLELLTSTSASMFVIVLRPDGTWRSVEGLAAASDLDDPDDAPRLGGRWNVYDTDIDLGSGISGQGSRVWLWLRRFGTAGGAISKGVNLSDDFLYIGRIAGSRVSDDDPTGIAAGQIKGTIAQGWSIEPAFVGSFHMKRWIDDGDVFDVPPDS